MKWKYLKSIAFLPVILLSSSCSTNYLVKDNNKAVKKTQKINFYTNNIDDTIATFHNIQYLDNTNFINAFEKEETNNDYYFYNQKTLDDFNQQKLISPFKLTKSIRDYFDFDKTNIDFELWKDKLWEFKVKTTEFLSVWRNEEIDRNLPFDKIGRLFGQMFFCIGPAKLKSFNFTLLEQITHNYIQNLNSFYKTNFVSLNDFPKNTPYFQSVLFYLSLLNDQLLYLEADNHTFLFLSNETEIDSFEYISYNQIVLYLKRIYFEIVYTFDYLHIINKLLTNFYSPNLDTEQDVIRAKEMPRDLGIFFLFINNKRNLLISMKIEEKNFIKWLIQITFLVMFSI
ncbi:hypothetical protein [Mycoplasmopsis glycophila]|uniref:Lipoprotein n=1 Tax=Mycoplasmopsis glycophila TaxID=171285 RepID=A0A449AUZ5_9BACT|nr:hypothetical protein [Mycoplasmopsis glycophila]VEU70339.1 Uncharacterised protein [Mycoplasmopsis glycophila]